MTQKESNLKTALVVDFMPLVRKVPFQNYTNIVETFEATWNVIVTASGIDRMEVIYDSYIENSIRESKRVHKKRAHIRSSTN